MAELRWHHNIHYSPVVVSSMPKSCGLALDVGCGQGLLTREMAAKSRRVVGIDLHEPSLEIAREEDGDNIEYLHDDFLTHPFAEESFDFIGSIASLHHMPLTTALARMVKLLRPGGIMCHIGCAESLKELRDLPYDVVYETAGFFVQRWNLYVLRKRWWNHGSPSVDSSDTYRKVATITKKILPGSRFRRHALWRYSLFWAKPDMTESQKS